MNPRAQELIRSLGLLAHPEGGWFREVFRAERRVSTEGGAERPALTTIYFLHVAGTFSRWHRLASDEVWHFYEGDPLELITFDPATGALAPLKLGPFAAEQEPVRVVPAGHWQTARSLGSYTFFGCSVGPGFEYADFAFVADLPAAAAHFAGELAPHRQWL
ncbi:MAG TPA: cupin domain-containing protein [Thermoanaerobaculia bacterium]|nr:cupin domain-containing protein [Thermoanaerobaculia bacterium]